MYKHIRQNVYFVLHFEHEQNSIMFVYWLRTNEKSLDRYIIVSQSGGDTCTLMNANVFFCFNLTVNVIAIKIFHITEVVYCDLFN